MVTSRHNAVFRTKIICNKINNKGEKLLWIEVNEKRYKPYRKNTAR